MLKSVSEQNLAKLAALYSGLVFGIYWIPIRALEAVGFPGLWATTMFNLSSSIIILPVILLNWRVFFPGRLRFHIIGFGSGLGYALYATAFVYTEVVSVVVLFYLMPVWGFVLARMFIGEKITAVRWLSMIVGFFGLWVILGDGFALPIPRNAGDWMAISAGFVWAAMALMILTDKQEKAVNYAAGFVVWACIITAISAVLANHYGVLPAAEWDKLGSAFYWLIPFSIIVIVPAAVATMYAPTKLNPGIVGLLFMTEISVGTITAAIWADEPFGSRQLMGVLLIAIAGVLETAWLYFKRPQLLEIS